jgi:hypothetical protein
MDPATKGDIDNIVVLIQDMMGRMDQWFEAVDRRFDGIDRRFAATDSRLDRIAETLAGVQGQMAAFD